MGIVQAFKHDVRTGNRGDAPRVQEIFYSSLREHGFTPVPGDDNPAVHNFGMGLDSRIDEFVATLGGNVCGFLILGPTDRRSCGELHKVFVDRSYRNQGIATMLVDACVARARERGYRELILETHVAFKAARRYYENHGWMLMPHLPAEVSPMRVYTRALWRETSGVRQRSST